MARSGSLRFSGRREVRELLAQGRQEGTDLGRAVWGRSPSPRGAAILFVVSKKVSKRSTERNRIRRQLTEAFRKCWQDQPFAIRAVVYVSPAVLKRTGRERRALAGELALRLGALARR